MAKPSKLARLYRRVDVTEEFEFLLAHEDEISNRALLGNDDARRVIGLLMSLEICRCTDCQDRLAATVYAFRLAGLN